MHVLRLARPSSDSWRGCRVVSIVATGYSAVYGTDENLVSVMMPFDRSFDNVHAALVAAAAQCVTERRVTYQSITRSGV